MLNRNVKARYMYSQFYHVSHGPSQSAEGKVGIVFLNTQSVCVINAFDELIHRLRLHYLRPQTSSHLSLQNKNTLSTDSFPFICCSSWQILEIGEVHDYHEGTYTCVVGYGRNQYMTTNAQLSVEEARKPQITDAPPADNNRVEEHSDLELLCTASGIPRPRIFWLRDAETVAQSLVTSDRYIVRSDIEMNSPVTIYDTSALILDETRSTETKSKLIVKNITMEDARGRYICYAANSAGSAKISVVIRVVKGAPPRAQPISAPETKNKVSASGNISAELESLQGDELVRRVIELARVRIDAAIKKTAEKLRGTNQRSSPSDIASLFRQPNRAALELAKAAEVYEAAIDEVTSILRQRNQHTGGLMNTENVGMGHGSYDRDPNSREALGVTLTADQLAIIAQLSGCQESVSTDPCFRQLCFHLQYRSIDGKCNNFNNPGWGAALSTFRRLLPPQYENGINTPIGWSATRSYFGYPKPSARLVSRELLGNATLMSMHKIM